VKGVREQAVKKGFEKAVNEALKNGREK